ncbi:MAG TPA: IS110 family transposase [Candidatus Limnocylindrales bacterium]|nr:IS110 family transposase [Candidatus Limnocylindrales bacterium]
MEAYVPEIWAGIDAGKQHHHCVVIDEQGRRLLSRRVLNDEAVLAKLISDVTRLADTDQVTWAVDLNAGGAALLIALLVNASQRLLYLSGRQVNRASGTYRGEGKTDARDAAVIADQARIRRDLGILRPGDEISVDLRILISRRTDLVADRTRDINRLRAQLLEISPALERALEVTTRGPLILLTGFQTPQAIRDSGQEAIESWLRDRHARNVKALALKAFTAAQTQQTTLPGQQLAADMVARLAKGLIALNQEIDEIEALIEDRFRRHRHAEVILSLPGIGVALGAEFLAATGGDMTAFRDADRLAGFAGLAPVPNDSGQVSGNLRRPRRYNRSLLRVFYLSAFVAIRCCTASRTFYDRKRREGKPHQQALIALARRRVNVLWALLRDGRPYQATHTAPAT